MTTEYLTSVRKQLEYYKQVAEKAIVQVDDDQLSWQYNDESNSIVTIVKHLYGNMVSRWTDFLTSDGEKDWRDRDREFENEVQSREELLSLWNKGWQCVFSSLDSLTEADLNKEIFIRNQSYSALDAINRQLAHYSYHVGQIVYIGKMVSGDHWISLTIPKGKSKEFNAIKFSEQKHK